MKTKLQITFLIAFCFILNIKAQVTYKIDTEYPVTATTTYNSTQTSVTGNIKIWATAAATMRIVRASNSKTTEDSKLTGIKNFIALDGAGLPTTGTKIPTQRYVTVDVTGSCKITVYGMSQTAGQTEKLIISDGTNELGSLSTSASAATLYKVEGTYTGEAGTIYLYADNINYKGFYIGAIIIQPVSTDTSVSTGEDFESYTVGSSLTMKKWYDADGTAVVVANPTNSAQKVASITTTNYDALLKLNIALPQGKVLSDYSKVSFDIYLNAGFDNNYKKVYIYVADSLIYKDATYPSQATDNTWTTKIFDLALPTVLESLNTFTLDLGINTNNGSYYIDNVKLIEKTTEQTVFTVENYETHSIDESLSMKKWYDADGTATVKANPTNAAEKSVKITTTNYDALLKLSVMLPTGKVLADYSKLDFDIYLLPNVTDQVENNYKKMNIYVEGTKIYEDSNYPSQATENTWTTKEYDLTDLTAGNSFELDLGLTTPLGNYYIDNVKLIEKSTVTSLEKTSAMDDFAYSVDDKICLNQIFDAVQLYDISGKIMVSEKNTSELKVSNFHKGIYILKAIVDSKTHIMKITK